MVALLSRLRPGVEHLVAVGLLLVAASPWLAVAAPEEARITVFGAVGAATLVGVVMARLVRSRPRGEAIVSGVALLVFALLVVLRDPLGFLELGRGLIDGLPRILSTTLPILDVRWASIPGVVVVWAGTAFVTALVARTRSIAAPLGIALTVFLAGYLATIGGRSGDPALFAGQEALLLVALIGVLAILRTDQGLPEGQRVRGVLRVVLAGGIVAGSVGIAAVAVARVPYLSEEPVTPSMESPAAPREPTSPLLVTRDLRSEEPDRFIGSVTVGESWSGYVPIAVLDRYDGRIWELIQGNFVPTGGTVPVDFPVGGGGQVRVEDVDIEATGGWLPFVARPSTVSGVSVLHNGGTALQPAEDAEGFSYQLQLSQPSHRLADADLEDEATVARRAVPPLVVPDPSADRRPAGERLCRLLAVSRNPAADREIGGEPCGRPGPDTVEFLRELARALRDGRSIPEDLVGGLQLETGSESLSDLLELVSQSGTQAAVGTPEQFASAFALIANDYGIPARVVTGFRVEEGAEDGTLELRGEHAWTWVEVPLDDVGWVVIDPSPTEEEVVEDDEQETAETAEEEQEVGPDQDRAIVGVDPSEVIGRAPPAEPMSPWVIAGLVVAGLLILLLLIMAVATTRRLVRRRRRRNVSDPRVRMLGAWHEALDSLYDAGLQEVEALSADEFVAEVSGRVTRVPDGATTLVEPLPWFAEATNRAVFSSRELEDEEVDRWWALTRRLRVGLRRSSSWRRRLAAMLLPAPANLAAPRTRRKAAEEA